MKFLNSISIASFVLIAGSFCSILVKDDSIVLKLTVINATINSEKAEPKAYTPEWNVHLFGVDSAGPLNLPINSSQTSNLISVEYKTSNSKPTNVEPVWNEAFTFSSDIFNGQTYIALELFQLVQVNHNSQNYFGGAELTVKEVKHFPHQFSLNLTDESGKISAQLNLEWQS